jgi:hypothetical protein
MMNVSFRKNKEKNLHRLKKRDVGTRVKSHISWNRKAVGLGGSTPRWNIPRIVMSSTESSHSAAGFKIDLKFHISECV